MDGVGRIMFSASEGGYPLAEREIRLEIGADASIERLGPDVGVISGSDISVTVLARRCATKPLCFVTHLTREVARLGPLLEPENGGRPSPGAVVAAAVEACGRLSAVAVQAWVSGTNPHGYGSAAIFAAIAEALRANGIEVSRAGQETVLSVCLAPTGVLVGLNNAADSISDWPGGRVRLARPREQISRAEFKLEEALQAFPVRLPATGTALDLGAAPGGWTRILRAHGLRVVAVDPGELDPRLGNDRGIRHEPTTAGEFLRRRSQGYDLVVNDMRMDARRSCEVTLAAGDHLASGGYAIATLKVGTRRVWATIDECLRLLRTGYTVIGARQLHHNRHEITVALRRTA